MCFAVLSDAEITTFRRNGCSLPKPFRSPSTSRSSPVTYLLPRFSTLHRKAVSVLVSVRSAIWGSLAQPSANVESRNLQDFQPVAVSRSLAQRISCGFEGREGHRTLFASGTDYRGGGLAVSIYAGAMAPRGARCSAGAAPAGALVI